MKLNLPYLLQDTDRHGNVRIYVRIGKKVRLKPLPGSPEFLAAYEEAVRLLKSATKPAIVTSVGTFGWLVKEYELSYKFTKKTPRDQRTIHLIFKSILDDETQPKSGHFFHDMPLKHVTPDIIRKLRDRKKDTPSAANHRLKVLRVMFDWGMEDRPDFVKANPATQVKNFDIDSSGYHTWTEAEVHAFEARHPLGTMPRLALDMMQYTGVRRSDAVLLGPKHLTEIVDKETKKPETWVVFKPFKTRRSTGHEIAMPLLDILRQSLKATPHGLETFLVTKFGKPFAVAGFGNWFRERCNEAGLPHCTAHGVRKVSAVRAAENGATEKQMMALFGWSSAQLAAFYAKQANEKKLTAASVHKLIAI